MRRASSHLTHAAGLEPCRALLSQAGARNICHPQEPLSNGKTPAVTWSFSGLGSLPMRNEDNNLYLTGVLYFQLMPVKCFVIPGLKALLDESSEAVTRVTVITVFTVSRPLNTTLLN